MKQELDNLTTEESLAHSPDIGSSGVKHNLSRISVSNLRREEILKYSLQEAEAKLQSLEQQKRMIRGTRQEHSARISIGIDKNKEDILKLEKQLEKLEKNSELMTNAIKKQNQQKIESFKVALKPLQDVIDMIKDTKITVASKLTEVDEKLETLAILEKDQMSDLAKKIEEEKEVKDQKMNFAQVLEIKKKESLWDYKEFIQDKETKEQLLKVREQKKQKIAALNETDKILAGLLSQIQILTRDIDCLKSSSISMESLKKNEKELEQLEEFIKLQCQNFNAPHLSEIIEELCICGNFPITQMISKEQFKLIERYELETIEKSKHQQEVFETSINELSKLIEEHETEIYALISIQQTDVQVEKTLKKSQRELEELRERYKNFNHSHDILIQQISDWKSENRNILLITDTQSIPTDEQVLELFSQRLKPFIQNPEHWRAMEGVIIRYCEKSKETDMMQQQILIQKQNDNALIQNKSENLKQVKAIKTAKEGERASLYSEFEKIIGLEKRTLKELENSKLEVESARKMHIKEKLQYVVDSNSNFNREKKTYGEKGLKKLLDKETNQIKLQLESNKTENKQKLLELYEEKNKWQKVHERLSNEISHIIKPKLSEIRKEMSKYTIEKTNLKRELKTLSEAEEEAHSELNSLAENKRVELVRGAKMVAKSHGGEKSSKIEQLYSLRSTKETEIIEAETELLKLEGGLTEKETKAELEIIKVKSKIHNTNQELSEILKSQKETSRFLHSTSKMEISIDPTDELSPRSPKNGSDSPFVSQQFLNIKTQSPDLRQSPRISLSNIHDYITEEIKDAEEISTDRTPSNKQRELEIQEIEEIKNDAFSDVSSEIPCPKELQYTYDKKDAKNKAFFEAIIPLIEGTIIYKMFKNKTQNIFDPLEGNMLRPEDCGYGIRKMKINKQLSKIEIRQIGKSGVESSIMIEQIVSVVVPAVTAEIIKAKKKVLDEEESTLEKEEEFSKVYRNMKLMGNMNFNSQAFVWKAKETCFYPFIVNLKGGRIEFVAEGSQVYRNWVQGIKFLQKNKSDLERLKYKIIPASP